MTYRHVEGKESSLGHNAISAVENAPGDLLYVASYGGGLDLFDPATGQVLQHYQANDEKPNSLTDDNIWSLTVTRTGQLWIGINSGSALFDPVSERFTRFKPNDITAASATLNGAPREGIEGIRQ